MTRIVGFFEEILFIYSVSTLFFDSDIEIGVPVDPNRALPVGVIHSIAISAFEGESTNSTSYFPSFAV